MIIIGIDPGLVTGMARYDTHSTRPPLALEVEYAGVGDKLEEWLYSVIPEPPAAVACEKYVMLPGPKSAQPEALMLMGVVDYMCKKYDMPLSWHLPKDTKKRAPNDLLRRLGWYQQTKDGHANDGQRLILEWLALNDPETFARLLGI